MPARMMASTVGKPVKGMNCAAAAAGTVTAVAPAPTSGAHAAV